jgi:hypothetical protein
VSFWLFLQVMMWLVERAYMQRSPWVCPIILIQEVRQSFAQHCSLTHSQELPEVPNYGFVSAWRSTYVWHCPQRLEKDLDDVLPLAEPLFLGADKISTGTASCSRLSDIHIDGSHPHHPPIRGEPRIEAANTGQTQNNTALNPQPKSSGLMPRWHPARRISPTSLRPGP